MIIEHRKYLILFRCLNLAAKLDNSLFITANGRNGRQYSKSPYNYHPVSESGTLSLPWQTM